LWLPKKRGFWRSLLQANVESEFSQRLEQEYLLPFARQQGLSDEELSAFRQTAVAQYQHLKTQCLAVKLFIMSESGIAELKEFSEWFKGLILLILKFCKF